MRRRRLLRHVSVAGIAAAGAASNAACARTAPGGGSVTPLAQPNRLGVAASSGPVSFPPIKLPTAEAPRADGKLTLLWFRAFDCPRCETMSAFAERTFDKYDARLVQQDADIHDEEQLVRRFHVPGTPTFVLLDPSGKELTRFFYEPNPDRLEARFVKFL